MSDLSKDPALQSEKKQHLSTKAPDIDAKLLLMMRARYNDRLKTSSRISLIPVFASLSLVIFITGAFYFYTIRKTEDISISKITPFRLTGIMSFKTEKKNISPKDTGNNTVIVKNSTPVIKKAVFPKGDHALEAGIRISVNNESSVSYSGNKVTVHKGDLVFHVTERKKGENLIVHSGNILITVKGTVFRVIKTDKISKVFLMKGSVEVTDGKTKKLLLPGESFPDVSRKLYTLKQVHRKLSSLRALSRHAEAAAYLRKVISRITPPDSPESLFIDLASIEGAHLKNWNLACSTLKKYRKRYPKGSSKLAADMLWNRYRCN
ncbi:MAG: FecR domain-containing protein [Deltaproteobacteria bacterium]|nr:FecR domain-containing protein [Deltaproteobacteria bacterium]